MEPTPLKLELVDIDDPSAKPAPEVDDDATVSPEMVLKDDATIDLKPVDRPVPITKGPPARIDAFAQQAAREYAQGHVDQPLWDRALSQAHGDKTAAAAIYVRARGTALRLLSRDRNFDATRPLPPPPPEIDPEERRRIARKAAFTRYRYPALGGLVLLAVAVGSAYYLLRGETPAPEAIVAARPAVAAGAATTSAAVRTGAPATPGAATPGASSAETADAANSIAALQAKIGALRDAGNWNVLVLYSVEWTRREPGNPAAWNQLRAGYTYLRQYDDALAAAKKAVQLAPGDPVMWRRLGEVNVALDDPPAALAAFREAATRDAADVASLQAIALLATRLGQPQEAKAALDRALAAQPGDAVTVCLRSGLTQLAPARDAYTALRQVSAVDAKCHGRQDGAAVAVK